MPIRSSKGYNYRADGTFDADAFQDGDIGAAVITVESSAKLTVQDLQVRKVVSKDPQGARVGYWACSWPSSAVGEAPVCVIPGDRWTREHTRQVVAVALGAKYEPLPREVQISAESQFDTLQNGPDATMQVSPRVRYLARSEADEGAAFRGVVTHQRSAAWPVFARELFASLYGCQDPATGADLPGREWVRSLLAKAKQSASWAELQRLTVGDPWAAGLGASEIVSGFGDAVDELLEGLPVQDPVALRADAAALADLLGPDHELTTNAQLKADAAMGLQLQVAESLDSEDFASIPHAVTAAAATLAGVSGQMAGLGVGGANPLLCSTPSEVRAALARNSELRKIAEVAGRLRIASRAARRQKTTYAAEQVVDVTLGSEIARLLPSELLSMSSEVGELTLLRKLNEGQALEYQLDGSEKLSKGPIVMVVDCSSSMRGARYEWAMGVTLALIETALKERRPFRFFTFNEQPQTVHTVDRPRDITIGKLEAMLAKFSGGGTNIGRALERATELVTEKAWQRADVVLVSDGEDGDFSPAIRSLAKQNVQTYGVAIGTTFRPGVAEAMAGVASVSDLQIQDGSANVDVVFRL